jgi:hypothetical protein
MRPHGENVQITLNVFSIQYKSQATGDYLFYSSRYFKARRKGTTLFLKRTDVVSYQETIK